MNSEELLSGSSFRRLVDELLRMSLLQLRLGGPTELSRAGPVES